MKWLASLSMTSLLLVSGCEDLECDPTFEERMGACVCPSGQVPMDPDGDGTRTCEPCPAGSMPVGEMCVSIGDAGMDAPDEDTGGDPCGGTCSGDTPHCDVDGDTCVACLENSHCDGSAPVCGADGTCGPCAGAADCSDYPGTVCDDGGDGACVACVEHSDCTDADAAQCDATTNTCVPCEDGSHCTEAGAGVCDTSAATNTCVECTIDTEAAACGGNSCNPATNACTDTPVGLTEDCLPCLADSECEPGHACVPMEFDGTPLEAHCLPIPDPGCGLGARPYGVPTPVRTSLSGMGPQQFCGVDESRVSCAAIKALEMSRECPGGASSECAADGAVCASISLNPNRCSYPCFNDENCPSGLACGGAGTDVCGGS